MKGIIHILFIMLLPICLINDISYAQSSFITRIASTKDETPGMFIQNSINEYIGIVYKRNTTSNKEYSFLYKLSEDGDSVLARKIDYPGSSLTIQYLVQSSSNPIQYVISGWGRDTNTFLDTITYISKIDSDFQPIWEKFYNIVPPSTYAYAEFWQNLLQKQDSGYLFATNYDNPGNHGLVLFELNEQGDSLQYKVFSGDSAGFYLWSLSYNHDTSAYYIYTHRAHYIPGIGECQRITLDLSLNQIDIQYFPRWFHDGLSPKNMPDGSVIIGGLYENMEPPMFSNMAAYKYDGDFNKTGECVIADPDYDIRKDNGRISLDYYYPNSIFLAGTFDWDVGIWVEHPSWIVIGKMDNDLNLIKETYVGGDAFYHFHTIVATSDGGVFLSASRYDYMTQTQERDAFLIKLDSNEVSVALSEGKIQNSKTSIFPNPGSNSFTLQTTEHPSKLRLFNAQGELIHSQAIFDRISQINTTSFPSGVYFWTLQENINIIDRGKWIKL